MPEGFHMRAALRDRYRPPEWALLFEVRNRTGFGGRERYADALAMSLYPSRGLEIIGIEVKQSRSDWLAEMRNPEKSCAIQKFCDRWYLAVSDKAIVQAGELPITWGLMVPRGKKIVVDKEAPKLEAEPITRVFVASMLRNATTNQADEKIIQAAANLEREKARKEYEESRKIDDLNRGRIYRELLESVTKFEDASGVSIRGGWQHEKIGAAVKLLVSGGAKTQASELENIVKRCESVAMTARTALEEMKAL